MFYLHEEEYNSVYDSVAASFVRVRWVCMFVCCSCLIVARKQKSFSGFSSYQRAASK